LGIFVLFILLKLLFISLLALFIYFKILLTNVVENIVLWFCFVILFALLMYCLDYCFE
jgi:hypothetical protein